MKRFSTEHVTQTAKRFAASTTAKSWQLFGREIRAALLDVVVMDEMRIAFSVDSEQTFTAEDVCKFRGAVEEFLRSGVVPEGSRGPHRFYRLED